MPVSRQCSPSVIESGRIVLLPVLVVLESPNNRRRGRERQSYAPAANQILPVRLQKLSVDRSEAWARVPAFNESEVHHRHYHLPAENRGGKARCLAASRHRRRWKVGFLEQTEFQKPIARNGDGFLLSAEPLPGQLNYENRNATARLRLASSAMEDSFGFRRHLHRLGFHLPCHSLRRRNAAAVPHGRIALLAGRNASLRFRAAPRRGSRHGWRDSRCSPLLDWCSRPAPR